MNERGRALREGRVEIDLDEYLLHRISSEKEALSGKELKDAVKKLFNQAEDFIKEMEGQEFHKYFDNQVLFPVIEWLSDNTDTSLKAWYERKILELEQEE